MIGMENSGLQILRVNDLDCKSKPAGYLLTFFTSLSINSIYKLLKHEAELLVCL